MSDMENQDELMDLPATLTLSKFAAARCMEIKMMKKALATTTGVKLAFQKLPKHMRRRAMSHNVKRLPRRLREIHTNQMKKSGLPPKQKRPSRKYRRRPYSLMSDYMRRQKRVQWLNTHIWHAKRFHMIEKWGYKIPNASCDKSFRACYRATVNHCLLQDLSYYSCIEFKGSYESIVAGFRLMTDRSTGLSLEAKAYISGLRGGKVTLFHVTNKKAIGIVDFLWRPVEENCKRVLWLWLHPAFYQEIIDAFIICFNFSVNGTVYVNDDNVEMNVHFNEISRFRLTGKLSCSVIYNTFQLAKESSSANWFKLYEDSIDTKLLACVKEHWDYFKYVNNCSVFSPGMVIPFVVLDPRFNLPKKRTKNAPRQFPGMYSPNLSTAIDSPLWKSEVRISVGKSKIPNSKIVVMRQKLLVPGSDLEEAPVPIPIILLHRSGVRGSENNGYGSGWDIIFPAKWAQPFWISLIMWGARAGGLRESNSIAFESNEQYCLLPDTKAGAEDEQESALKCRERFFKLPPNKRTNFNKFSISCPFDLKWKLLVEEWQDRTSKKADFMVLRNREVLRQLQEDLKSKSSNLSYIEDNFLIPVRVTLSSKGACKPFAIICLPEQPDYRKEPVEHDCKDVNEKMRKEMRKEHKTLLKRLRRRRIRAKLKNEVIPDDRDKLKDYTAKMRKLWLPETSTIRQSCSRQVIGFVKQGDFSFSLGKAKGIGYIASGALSKLLATKSRDRVLIRNISTKQYRMATLDIIFD